MIRYVLNFYILILIVDAILSYIPSLRHHSVTRWIRKAANFTLAPVRKALPPDLPVDFSPFIVIIAIRLLMALW